MTKPCYSEQILPVPWPCFISKFHCNRIQLCDDFLFTLLYSLTGYKRHVENITLVKALFYFTKILQVYLSLLYCKDRNRALNKHTKQSIALFLLDNKKDIILHSSRMLPCEHAFSRLDTKCPSLEKPPLTR